MDGPERVVWEVAGKPVAVRLHPEMVGRLTIAVREGFKALPRRGLETGGILLGTRHVAGKPVAVRLHPEMVGRLTIAVREGFKALPRRGLETGGILLGTRHEAGRQTVVEIDDFEGVECEHAAGPSYLLSDLD